MANSDWRDVYRQESRRPGYVIDNGKSLEKLAAKGRGQCRATLFKPEKTKAA